MTRELQALVEGVVVALGGGKSDYGTDEWARACHTARRHVAGFLNRASDKDATEQVREAAYEWWLSRRPVSWDQAEHLKNPGVNTMSDAERKLALAVAKAEDRSSR